MIDPAAPAVRSHLTRKPLRTAVSSSAASAMLVLLFAAPAAATFHVADIHRVMTGLNGTTDVPALQVAFDGHDFDGAKFFSQLAGLHWLAGTIALKTSFTASGRNQQEMMAGLKGDFSIGVRDGEITGSGIVQTLW